MRLVKSLLVPMFIATGFILPVSSAQASADCVVDNFTNAAGSDSVGDRTFRFCMGDGALAGETISFAHGNTQRVIELESEISRSSDVVIDGEGYLTLTLAEGQSDFRMIDISADIEVIGMTFRDGVADQGSAIHTTAGGNVTIRDSQFINNEASATGSEANNFAAGGGAIDGDGSVFVYASTFSGNSSGRDGGAILAENDVIVDEDSNFLSNIAKDDGGAIYARDGNIIVTNSTFTDNKASEGEDSNYVSQGGALYSSLADTKISVTNSIFIGNHADDAGGAIRSNGDVSTMDSDFRNNFSSGGDGGAVYTEAANEDSSFVRTEFNQNRANEAGDGDGGAVYVDSDANYVAEFEDCTFTLNSAGDDGGAVYIDEGARFESSTFRFNTAGDSGGAVYIEDEDIDVIDSVFFGNDAGNDGGAVLVNEDLTSLRSSFVSNVAGDVGGAVESDDDVIIDDSYFGFNTASGDGGALEIEDELRISNSTFYRNESSDKGGAIWSSEDEETSGSYIVYSTFIDNSAETEGSAFHFLGDDIDLFANLMLSSQDSEQITGITEDIVDHGANVSSFEGEPAFDHLSSVGGVELSALRARDPLTATVSLAPTVRFGNLAKTEAEVTQGLIEGYEEATGRALPITDQLENTRTVSFFAGAEFFKWRSGLPIDYAGPIISDVGGNGSTATFVAYSGENVLVLGERLSSITKAFIDDVEAQVSEVTEEQFLLSIPEGTADGIYEIVLHSPSGILKYEQGLRIANTISPGVQANSVCESAETTIWTTRISDTQAKAYIKCPIFGQKYRILHQTGGSGSYEAVFVKTIASESDAALISNSNGLYIVRTIELDPGTNRIRVSADGIDIELNGMERPVRYNR